MAPDLKPVPDPTALTTEASRRDINALREVLESERAGDMRYLEEKFRGLDDKIQLIVQLGNRGVETKIDSVEARLDRGDGKIVGQAYKDTGGQQTIAFVFAIIMAVIALASLAVAFFRH